jgi:hypothetical protein
LLVGEFSEHASHGFFSQTWIRINDFSNRHAGCEGFQNERYGNSRVPDARASAQVLRVSDNPVVHAFILAHLDFCSSSEIALQRR